VRVRPLSKQEKAKQAVNSVRVLDEKIVILKDESEVAPEAAFRQGNRSKEQTYAFDVAFDERATQQYVFERSTQFLIDGIVSGYNGSVFAYGATGAGKTHTMLGEKNDLGIMGRSVHELFR
jgi:kinesin family protein 18/19